MQAYLDESIRERPGGCYVFAAAVVSPQQAGHVRAELRDLRLPQQPRLHWHIEDLSRRVTILKLLTSLDICGIAALQPIRHAREQERRRGLCLATLTWQLWQHGVQEMVIESRGDRLDQEDRRRIAGLQRSGQAPHLRYRHERPTGEPLLWAADALAGAVAADAVGTTSIFREHLDSLVTVLR